MRIILIFIVIALVFGCVGSDTGTPVRIERTIRVDTLLYVDTVDVDKVLDFSF